MEHSFLTIRNASHWSPAPIAHPAKRVPVTDGLGLAPVALSARCPGGSACCGGQIQSMMSRTQFDRRSVVDVPTLEVVTLQDAKLELSLTGKRGVMMRQYMDYIAHLETGQAGKLIPDEGETTAAIRRRLGAAARLLGKSLVVNRLGDVVFFWEESSGAAPRRRGRRKSAGPETE